MPSLAVMDSAWSATSMQLSTWKTPGSKVTAHANSPQHHLLIYAAAVSLPGVAGREVS